MTQPARPGPFQIRLTFGKTGVVRRRGYREARRRPRSRRSCASWAIRWRGPIRWRGVTRRIHCGYTNKTGYDESLVTRCVCWLPE